MCTEIAEVVRKDVVSTNTFNKTSTRAADVNNRKVTYTIRYGITEGNMLINAIQLQDTMRALLPENNIFTNHNISVNIGVGDGSTSTFKLPTSNYKSIMDKFYIDSIETSNFIVKKGIVGKPPLYFNTDEGIQIIDRDPEEVLPHFGSVKINSGIDVMNKPLIFKCSYPYEIAGIQYTAYQYGAGGSYFYTYYSEDGEKWEEVLPRQSIMRETRMLTFMFSESIKNAYIKIAPTTSSGYSGQVWAIRIIPAEPVVMFNTPPPEGAIITADYKVPYIPKTEDYVLDVTAEIQFGEGV